MAWRSVLLVVVTLVVGVAALDVRNRRSSLLQSREENLRNDLKVMREVIGQYRGDRGVGPRSLEALVREGYLRKLPTDPITGSAQTWQVSRNAGGEILEIHSGARTKAKDATPYSSW